MHKSFLLLVFVWPSLLSSAQDTCTVVTALGISFPPVQNSVERDSAKVALDDLGVSKIRFGENWDLREPTQGNFNWAPLDARIDWAELNGYEVLLTIDSNGPAWACSGVANAQSCVYANNAWFQTYCDSLFSRYSGRISKVQFGNEWQSTFWYAGNAEQFYTSHNVLYNSVQTYSPSTKVVLGGFTTSSLRWLAGCAGVVTEFYESDGTFVDSGILSANCPPNQSGVDFKNRIDSVLTYAQYDWLDLHMYDDVEQWDEYFYNFADTITKPILVSEFGGPSMAYEPYTEQYQANRVYQYIKKLDSLQIAEAYFFKLVEGTNNTFHSTSGLIADTTLVLKPAYHVYKGFGNNQLACLLNIENPNDDPIHLNIYPNPTDEQSVITIANSVELKDVTIYVINYMGEMVDELSPGNIVPGNHSFELNTSHYASGVYQVILQANGSQQIMKLVKE